MPNASAPFKAKSPFSSRVIGLDYQAFPLDFINPPFPTRNGCLHVTPEVDFNSSGHEGGPFTPPSAVYTLTNSGSTTMDWTLTISEVWLSADSLSGTLDPGESVDVTVTLDADTLPEDAVPYEATLTWTNTTNACGDTVTNVNLSVTGDLTLTVEGRYKGGSAILCGWPEYTSISVPPKRYKVKTLSGIRNFLHYPNGTCSGPPDCTVVDTYSGDCTYLPDSGCSVSTGGQFIRTVTALCGAIPGTFSTCSAGTPVVPAGDSEVLTRLTRALANNGFCGEDGGQSGNRTISNPTETISSEDTEADAIVRLLASTTFSAWSTIVIKGGLVSEYEARVTGTSQVYQFAQWRVTGTGLTPSTLYNGSATIYRRLYGSSDPWVFVSTQVLSGTTDGSGNFADGPFDLPNARGYEYTIWDAGLTP